jgi:hypothetical protein
VIFILAGAYSHARKWAQAQHLADNEWFSSLDLHDLHGRENFHVIVLDSASELPSPLFERLWTEAQMRGRRNRK